MLSTSDRIRPEIHEGRVIWFDPLQGYGYIERANDSDLFVHYKDIIRVGDGFRRLYKGQYVRYRVAMGARGEYACKVFPSQKWLQYVSKLKKC